MTQDNDAQPEWFDSSKDYNGLELAKMQYRLRAEELELHRSELELEALVSPYNLKTADDLLGQYDVVHQHWLRCVEITDNLRRDEWVLRVRTQPGVPEEKKAEYDGTQVQVEEALQSVTKFERALSKRIYEIRTRRAELQVG